MRFTMRYGQFFAETVIPKELIYNTVHHIDNLKDASVSNNINNSVTRTSKVSFIKNNDILQAFLDITFQVNKLANWDLHLDAIEPLQYGEYHKNNEYGWHVDQHSKVSPDNRVRKLSFSIFLNDDYEGGEFDLEVFNPTKEQRYITFDNKMKKNTALFFYSDYWHRVRPIQKGVRKSLVGWVLGHKYK